MLKCLPSPRRCFPPREYRAVYRGLGITRPLSVSAPRIRSGSPIFAQRGDARFVLPAISSVSTRRCFNGSPAQFSLCRERHLYSSPLWLGNLCERASASWTPIGSVLLSPPDILVKGMMA